MSKLSKQTKKVFQYMGMALTILSLGIGVVKANEGMMGSEIIIIQLLCIIGTGTFAWFKWDE